jgi:hypothetical protein
VGAEHDRGKAGRRFVVEAAVIVGSILLAFAIDAAGASYRESQEERRVLKALEAELLQNSNRLDQAIAFHLEVRESANLILDLASSRVDVTSDSVAQLLSDLSWWRHTDFQTGALDALLFGGGLSTISSEELRRGLFEWKRTLDEYVLMEGQDYTYYIEHWVPFLRANANVPAVVARVGSYPGDASRYDPGDPPPVPDMSTDHALLLRNREFLNVVMQKRLVQDNALGFSEGLRMQLDRTLQLLRSEAARGTTQDQL